MPADTNNDAVDACPIQARSDGLITYDGVTVGRYTADEDLLTLDLGWLKMAGLSLKVLDDNEIDRHRNGVALERRVPAR